MTGWIQKRHRVNSVRQYGLRWPVGHTDPLWQETVLTSAKGMMIIRPPLIKRKKSYYPAFTQASSLHQSFRQDSSRLWLGRENLESSVLGPMARTM